MLPISLRIKAGVLAMTGEAPPDLYHLSGPSAPAFPHALTAPALNVPPMLTLQGCTGQLRSFQEQVANEYCTGQCAYTTFPSSSKVLLDTAAWGTSQWLESSSQRCLHGEPPSTLSPLKCHPLQEFPQPLLAAQFKIAVHNPVPHQSLLLPSALFSL